MKGYAGKILDVDLSTNSTRSIAMNELDAQRLIGARGIMTKLLWDRLSKSCFSPVHSQDY
jgi:aldehyde:ferredoxin oxidoreductase